MKMKYSIKEIAQLFSNGKFETIFDSLNEGIVWTVIGENIFNGKKAVVQNCKDTVDYFKTVQTDFKTTDIIVSKNKVIILGTGEFKRGNKQISFVSACDVYEFDENSKILKIDSYCIPEKNN